jgi:hypothetical protein
VGTVRFEEGLQVSLISMIKQAVSEATPELTQSLRKSAYDQGWDADAGRSLQVNFSENSFDIKMSQAAEDLEYGNMDRPPSAAVRRWSNDTNNIGQALITAVERRIASML